MRAISYAVLIVFVVGLFLPLAGASGGAAPTTVCTVNLAPSAFGAQYNQVKSREANNPSRQDWADVDSSANVYVIFDVGKTAGGRDGYIRKYSPNCVLIWQESITCTGTATCRFNTLHVDAGQRLVAVMEGQGLNADRLIIRRAADGDGLGDMNLSLLSPAIGDVNDIDSFRTSATSLDYLIAGSGRLARITGNISQTPTQIFNVAVADITGVRHDGTNSFVYTTSRTGTSCTIRKHNPTTGAVISSYAQNGDCSGQLAERAAPIPGMALTTQAYKFNADNSSFINEWSYDRIIISSWTRNPNNPDITPPGIQQPGNLLESTSADWDLSQRDGLVLCGVADWTGSGGGFRTFYAEILTSNRTEFWNTSSSFGDYDGQQCVLTYDNRLWGVEAEIGGGDDQVRLRFLSGGDASGALQRPTATVTGSPGTGSEAPPEVPQGIISQIQTNFADAWGLDDSVVNWLFGIAIVSIMVVAFAKVSTTPLVLASAALLGVGLAYFLDYFPLWFLLVIIFAVIGLAGHRLMGSRGAVEAD